MLMKSVSAVLCLALGVLFAGCSSPSVPTDGQDEAAANTQAPAAVEASANAPAAAPEATAPASDKPAEVRGHFTVVSDEHVSRITWTATKDGGTQVVGDFTRIAGGLFLDPADLSKMDGTFDVHLLDIDSKNPARDANMSELLFGAVAAKATTAVVEIRKVTPVKTTLAVGETTAATAEFNLGLISGAVTGSAEVALTRLEEGRWKVLSSSPIQLSLEKLSLKEQTEALRSRCAHQSIGDGVELSLAIELMTRPVE